MRNTMFQISRMIRKISSHFIVFLLGILVAVTYYSGDRILEAVKKPAHASENIATVEVTIPVAEAIIKN